MYRSLSKTVFVLACAVAIPALAAGGRLINGTPVAEGTFKEIVQINADGASCGATVVGPKAILTSAHCVQTGGKATFTIGTKAYEAEMTRSPLYPGKDHDLAVGLVNQEVTGVNPAVIGGTAEEGVGIQLYGYGCTNPDGSGGNDGILRTGDTVITQLVNHAMVSRKAGGAALCFKDSGGPAYVEIRGKRRLLGVASTGNIKDTNYHTRTDLTDTTDFLTAYASEKKITICGINSTCDTTPPVKPKPTCTLTAAPNPVTLGQKLIVSMGTTGEVTLAKIEDTEVPPPTFKLELTPDTAGTFTAHGTVEGPGGKNSCEAAYVVSETPVPPEKPNCTLTASPASVKVGEWVTLQLTTQNEVTTATIDGTKVSFPTGTKKIAPTKAGSFTSLGVVEGPGGKNSCTAIYEATEGPTPPPPPSAPELAVVPTYCGKNTLIETHVKTVCLAVLKKQSHRRSMVISQALKITYGDGSNEVMPILVRKAIKGAPGDIQTKEDLLLYANGSVPTNDYLVLDTRQATLTSRPPQRDDVPFAIEGHTAKGNYFKVDALEAQGSAD